MYTITYTQSLCGSLDDDFTLKTAVALTYEELCIMMYNISEFFDGIVIHVEEHVKQIKRRKVTRREQRPKVSKHLRDWRHSR